MIKFDETDYSVVERFFNELRTDAELRKAKYPDAQFEISLTEKQLELNYKVRGESSNIFLIVIETETIWKNIKRPIYFVVEDLPEYDIPKEQVYGEIEIALDKINEHYKKFWQTWENCPDRLFEVTKQIQLSNQFKLVIEHSDIKFKKVSDDRILKITRIETNRTIHYSNLLTDVTHVLEIAVQT